MTRAVTRAVTRATTPAAIRELVVPPTRNHRQLANWVNTADLVDERGRRVEARVSPWTSSTDRPVPGTRLRLQGKGRRGLRLEIWVVGAGYGKSHALQARPDGCLFVHISSDTYRQHSEAREWVARNLKHARRPRRQSRV